MEILDILVSLVLILFLLIDIRSSKVSNFRISLVLLDLSDDRIRMLHNKYTYNQMLFSFKPLKLEAWFTEEELKEDNND